MDLTNDTAFYADPDRHLNAAVARIFAWYVNWYTAASRFDTALYNRFFWIVYKKASPPILSTSHGWSKHSRRIYSKKEDADPERRYDANKIKVHVTSLSSSSQHTAADPKYISPGSVRL